MSDIRRKFRNKIITDAFIETTGDPNAGIQPYLCCISQIHFDLACLADSDVESSVEAFREKLADAFEIALGERPIVWFGGEQ